MAINYNLKIDKEMLLDAIDSKLNEIADMVLSESQKNIVNNGLVYDGTLLKSGNINREYLNKTVIYPVVYAEEVEYGRLPGSMPPLAPIQDWVRKKLNVRDEKESSSIAWAIMTDIKKNGKEPRPFLRPAIETTKIKCG